MLLMSFLDKLMPRDVIAGMMLVGGIYLKSIGINGTVDMFLMGIAGVYFGAELFIQKTRD